MKRTLFHSYITRFFLAAALLGQLSCGKDPAVSPSGNESGSSTETSSETETRILKEASSGSTPANIIIMGDGFTKEDYAANGTFYPAATRAMNGLLSVEPFKTYSAYFRVQTVAVYSQERGTSFKNSSTQKIPHSQPSSTVAEVPVSPAIMPKCYAMPSKPKISITNP